MDVPHDWGVEVPFSPKAESKHGSRAIGPGLPENNIGWYRKTLTIPESDRARRIAVEFDGIFRNAVVWFNGHDLGREHSGYSGSRFDLTDHVNCNGRNTLGGAGGHQYIRGLVLRKRRHLPPRLADQYRSVALSSMGRASVQERPRA